MPCLLQSQEHRPSLLPRCVGPQTRLDVINRKSLTAAQRTLNLRSCSSCYNNSEYWITSPPYWPLGSFIKKKTVARKRILCEEKSDSDSWIISVIYWTNGGSNTAHQSRKLPLIANKTLALKNGRQIRVWINIHCPMNTCAYRPNLSSYFSILHSDDGGKKESVSE